MTWLWVSLAAFYGVLAALIGLCALRTSKRTPRPRLYLAVDNTRERVS